MEKIYCTRIQVSSATNTHFEIQPYLVLIFVFQKRFGKDVDEFGEVFKVLGHLGGQHHVDDTLPNDFVAFPIQSW